jgi:hypothetical protein
MYIQRMRTAGRLFTILTVVALVSPWAPALLCARPGAGAMPCCKTEAPCDFQMQANRCCSIGQAAAAPAGTAGTPANSALSVLSRPSQVAVVDLASPDGSDGLRPPGRDRLWYPPAHDRSPSLFLRNASILR